MFNPPFYTNVTQKGQVTIPVDFRKQAGISTKEKVTVSVEKDKIVIKPVKDITQLFGKYKLRKPLPAGYTLDNIRGYMETHYFDEK